MINPIKRWILNLILWGYSLLYHRFAWMYAFAAWLVSAGRWDNWIRATGEFQLAGPLLDIGCGQGILLDFAGGNGIIAFGLDESQFMLRRGRKRFPAVTGIMVRGLGQCLPFDAERFNTITATFPAPYLFEHSTIEEIYRLLAPRGQLIILVTAVVSGHSLHDLFLRVFSGVFGFGNLSEQTRQRLLDPLQQTGWQAEIKTKQVDDCLLYFIHAQKKPAG